MRSLGHSRSRGASALGSGFFEKVEERLRLRVSHFYGTQIPKFPVSVRSQEIALLCLSETTDPEVIDSALLRYINELQQSLPVLTNTDPVSLSAQVSECSSQISALNRDIQRIECENASFVPRAPSESRLDSFQRESLANLQSQIDKEQRDIENLQMQLDFTLTRINLLRGSRELTPPAFPISKLPELKPSTPRTAPRTPTRERPHADLPSIPTASNVRVQVDEPRKEETPKFAFVAFRIEDIEMPPVPSPGETAEDSMNAILSDSDGEPEQKPVKRVEPPKSEPKAEPKPVPKAERKDAPKVELPPKVEPKPQPKVEAKSEPKIEAKSEPKIEDESQTKTVPNSVASVESKSAEAGESVGEQQIHPVAPEGAPPEKSARVKIRATVEAPPRKVRIFDWVRFIIVDRPPMEKKTGQ
jgi:hypothetical protein